MAKKHVDSLSHTQYGPIFIGVLQYMQIESKYSAYSLALDLFL